MNRDRIGFNAFWWEGLVDQDRLRRAAEHIARIGYKAVEWKETSFRPDADMGRQLSAAVKISGEAGLAVSDFVVLRDYVKPGGRQQRVSEAVEFIRAVGETGVKVVNTATGGVPEGVSLSAAWDNVYSSFERLLKAAEETDTVIAFEPVGGCVCRDYFTGEVLLRKFDHPRLKVTFDPSHYFLYRNDIPWVIRQWRDKIQHVHLKDAVGVAGQFGVDFMFPILGEGAIDFSALAAALDDIGYDGHYCAEFESFKYMDEVLGNDPVAAAEITWRSIEKLWPAA